MKSNKIIHHPSNNADNFSDVGTEIEAIKTTATALSGTVSSLSSTVTTLGTTVTTLSAATTNSFSSGFLNGALAASVSGNALTVSVKTAGGADPSASEPVYIVFRDVTTSSGAPVTATITSALSITLSSGSTVGTSNSVAFRLWVVAFNDAGTVRLGLVNLWAPASFSLMALDETGLASSTAEGGAGAADSAQVFYTGTAVSSKTYRILGFLEYSSGLATAGTWSSAPSKVQLMGPGIKKPGDLVATVQTRLTTVATGTTQIPYDDTVPQNTEGDQYLSQAITPTSAANLLLVEVNVPQFASSVLNNFGIALFQDSTASALAVFGFYVAVANAQFSGYLTHIMQAGTTSATTLKVRMGGGVAGTTTINGRSSTRFYGGASYASLRIQEIMG